MSKKGVLYDKLYSWAYGTGRRIIEARKDSGDGVELVRRLIFAVRGEETPGRFLARLTTTLAEYRTNQAYRLDVDVPGDLVRIDLRGDSFYYAKAAILAGFIDALTPQVERKEEGRLVDG